MDFTGSVRYLYSLGNEVEAMKLGLDNIRTLLAALGDPQKQFLKVQVAGTNGKGSVCAFLNSICLEARVKTGLYTSPHLISITERVRINGIDISEGDFSGHASLVRETAERLLSNGDLEYRPTFFEQMTAIALVAFAEAKVELAILETGLGGRLDATTAADAEMAAITRIDYDHQEYLGETIEEIAAEKAAIIHLGSKVVVGDQLDAAMSVIRNRCNEFGITPIVECETGICAIDSLDHSAVAIFRTPRDIYSDASLGLSGRHQIDNARIAVMLSEVLRFDFHFDIRPVHVLDGLGNARHPGRLEYQGRYLFDGAHNIGGAKALREYLDESITQPITLIFGAMKDKQVAEIAAILFSKAASLILTQSSNPRAMSALEIVHYAPGQTELIFTDNVADAMRRARSVSRDDTLILVTGSLYLVGEVKQILRDNPAFEI